MEVMFFPKQSDFRKWLKKNHKKESELWIGYYKKSTGKESITYKESLDEALCFGWIDGIRKSIDDESYTNRFTPRRKRSNWSSININRMRELIETGKVMPAGMEAFNKRDEKETTAYSFEQGSVKLPAKYEKLIKANEKAYDFFKNLPSSAKKLSIWFVMSAKKEETILKRLTLLITSSEQGLRLPQFKRAEKK